MKSSGVQAHRIYKGYEGCRKVRWSGIMRARLSEDGYWGVFLGKLRLYAASSLCLKEQI